MKVQLFSTVSILLAIASQLAAEQAETPFFWDDFNRDSLTQGDVDWRFWKTSDNGASLVDGNLIMQPSRSGSHTHIFAATPTVGDFSIRTQLRFAGGSRAWAGVVAPTLLDGDIEGGYWAGVQPSGILSTGSRLNDVNVVADFKDVLDPSQAFQRDIHVQYDASDSQVALYAWYEGEEKPDEPQLSTPQEVLDASDAFAIRYEWYAEDGPHVQELTIPYFAVLPAIAGDFNASGSLDLEDMDLMDRELRGPSTNRVFDLNEDALVAADDRHALIKDLLGTWYGDSNLDREFNTTDLVTVFQAGEYEDAIRENSSWATGDWNGDSDFDTADLVLAFQDGGFEQGSLPLLRAVPEPTSLLLLSAGVIVVAACERRREHLVPVVRPQNHSSR